MSMSDSDIDLSAFTTNESFADLFEESLKDVNMEPGAIVSAKIMSIENDYVIVNAGLKSESAIPIAQFRDAEGELEAGVGDVVEVVVVDPYEDRANETLLSYTGRKVLRYWEELAVAHEEGAIVRGRISNKVKGGFTVEIGPIRAFLPGSLIDVRPVRDTSGLEGRELEFKVIKLDKRRNNVVVSRRSVVEEESSADREALLESLDEGQEVKGIVKNLTDYGAFVDLGGIDGLLHITDMAWKRIKHPGEVVTVGDEINVKILKFDREKNRVSLGLKQLGSDPWLDLTERYPEKLRLKGKVTNITDYGCFVEIEEGVEGLVHVSEMDWTNKNIHPSKVVQLGDEVEVMVLEIDPERRRISLGIKQCQDNPWASFEGEHQKGSKITGKIKSITDFGIFIGLPGNIDGLVHLSDISWDESGEAAIRNYKKGQEIEAIILAIDSDRERISLGIKQMDGDPFAQYLEENEKSSYVKGKVVEAGSKGVHVDLAEGIEGYIRMSELSEDRVADATDIVKVGEEVEARVIGIDRKARRINLSLRPMDTQEALEQAGQGVAAKSTTLGDLFKEQMEGQDSEQDDK